MMEEQIVEPLGKGQTPAAPAQEEEEDEAAMVVDEVEYDDDDDGNNKPSAALDPPAPSSPSTKDDLIIDAPASPPLPPPSPADPPAALPPEPDSASAATARKEDNNNNDEDEKMPPPPPQLQGPALIAHIAEGQTSIIQAQATHLATLFQTMSSLSTSTTHTHTGTTSSSSSSSPAISEPASAESFLYRRRPKARTNQVAIVDGLEVQLLQLFDSHGRISREKNADVLLELMLQATRDESRVLLLQVLKSASEECVLDRLIQNGVLRILKHWLLAYEKDIADLSILRLCLEVVKDMPVTYESLRSSNVGKLVTKIKKDKKVKPTTPTPADVDAERIAVFRIADSIKGAWKARLDSIGGIPPPTAPSPPPPPPTVPDINAQLPPSPAVPKKASALTSTLTTTSTSIPASGSFSSNKDDDREEEHQQQHQEKERKKSATTDSSNNNTNKKRSLSSSSAGTTTTNTTKRNKTTSSSSSSKAKSTSTTTTKKNSKGHSLRWTDEATTGGKLTTLHIFERAPYEEEDDEGFFPSPGGSEGRGDLRTMASEERKRESEALKKHNKGKSAGGGGGGGRGGGTLTTITTQLPWRRPRKVLVKREEEDGPPAGGGVEGQQIQTPETVRLDAYHKGRVEMFYIKAADIPPTPHEDVARVGEALEEYVTTETGVMPFYTAAELQVLEMESGGVGFGGGGGGGGGYGGGGGGGQPYH